MAAAAAAEPPGFYYPHFEVGQITQSSADGAVLVSDAYTLELWVRLDQAPENPQNVLCGQQAFGIDFAPPGNDHRWWLSSDTGGWSTFLVTDEGQTGTPPVALTSGSWVHLAATYDGAALRLFVDGGEAASVALSGSTSLYATWEFNPSCPFDPQMLVNIGGGPASGGWGFQGSVREVALWDHALEAGDLAARQSGGLTGAEPGLLHFWPLDDGHNQEPNAVAGGPLMTLGFDPLDEGPYFGEPEWRLTEPFYAIREDLIDDLPPPLGPEDYLRKESWGVIDLNHDGLEDFLYNGTTGWCMGDLRPFRALLNDGTGHFVDGTSTVFEGPVPEARGAFRAQVADFNGDGLLDFFGGNIGHDGCETPEGTYIGGTNSLFLTNEAGKLIDASGQLLGHPCTLTEPLYPGQARCYGGGEALGRPPGVRYPDTGADPVPLFRDFTHSSASGDIDNDGDVDVFVFNLGGDGGYESPYFLVNDGEGNFLADYDAVPLEVRTPDGNNWVGCSGSYIDDLDGDGAQDLLALCGPDAGDEVAPPGTFTIRGGIYWGDGSGDFSMAERTPFPRARSERAAPTWVLPLDIDGDGDKDLIIAIEQEVNGIPFMNPDALPLYVQVLVNHGSRQFIDETAERVSEQTSLLIWALRLIELDVNADGCPDFLIENEGAWFKENLYVNNCHGRFTPLPPAVVGKLRDLVPIDIDGDGGVDFISYAHFTPDHSGDFAVLEQLRPVDARPWLSILFDNFESGPTFE